MNKRENWNSLMYTAFNSDVNLFLGYIVLILWIFIGNYILLNLVLGILLEGFSLGSFNTDDL
ncbi:MAG: ion transporter [bacterium]